jgi:hypothetical protein
LEVDAATLCEQMNVVGNLKLRGEPEGRVAFGTAG